MRDLPSGAALVALGREASHDGKRSPERERELHLLATASAIAEREAAAGDAPALEIAGQLRRFYGGVENVGGEVDIGRLLHRLAADLRAGAFEGCAMRGRAANAILWRLTIWKLREGNPQFLAANGFGD
jgi:hypothetical protein